MQSQNVVHRKYFVSINNRQIRIGDGELDAMRFDSVFEYDRRVLRNIRSVHPFYASESLNECQSINPFLKIKLDGTF